MYSYMWLKTCGRPIFLGFLMVLIGLSEAFNNDPHPAAEACPKLQMQRSLDLEQLTGSWYVVETVMHTNHSRSEKINAPKGNLTCAVLNLELHNSSTLQLKWKQSQAYPTIEYTLDIPDNNTPGKWISRISPWRWDNDNEPEQINVMKAVGDHAVLTFCQPSVGGHVFSALIGRRNTLTPNQIRGVNEMLQRRGLPIKSSKIMDDSSCQEQQSWVKGTASGTRINITFYIVIIAAYCMYM